jgi:LacI family transcriptional regulator
MTLGALLATQEMGIRIPKDTSVVGFDDPEWAPLTNPPLTTLAQPTYEMGVRAMRLLLDRIEGILNGNASKVLLEPRARPRVGGDVRRARGALRALRLRAHH